MNFPTSHPYGSLETRQVSKRHADHADTNASFNIGNPVSYCVMKCQSIGRLHEERDSCEGSTDTPKTAILEMTGTVELNNVDSAKPTLIAKDEDGE